MYENPRQHKLWQHYQDIYPIAEWLNSHDKLKLVKVYYFYLYDPNKKRNLACLKREFLIEALQNV